MRLPIYATTVEDIYRNLPPDTDLRSGEFLRAVIDELIKCGVLELDTDGIDVAVSVESQ